MSRIGRQLIPIPAGVTIAVSAGLVTVRGPKGELSQLLHSLVAVEVAKQHIAVKRSDDSRVSRAVHGLTRSLLANMVTGVTDGWKKELEMSGVGYRASLEGQTLFLAVGFSHPIKMSPPEGIVFTIHEGKIVVSGIDKAVVGQVAANIRKLKPPEPYKGKGIRYVGERVRRKAGKVGKVGEGSK